MVMVKTEKGHGNGVHVNKNSTKIVTLYNEVKQVVGSYLNGEILVEQLIKR